MKPFLVIQHVESEDAGAFGRVLRERSIETRLVRIFAGDPVPEQAEQWSGLLVMGGPMNVQEASGRYPNLADEMELIRLAHREGMPVLGICLGAQLVAAALGARVYDGGVKEIGWHEVAFTRQASSDPLLKDFPERLTVLQWHGQTFDLPQGATVHLASSPLYPNQAFRYGQTTWALQFHLEATGEHVRRWMREGSAELAGCPKVDRDALVAGIEKYEAGLIELAEILFARFISNCK
ncbi:MAG: type 1 glutamine amidotransferase [Gemmatimonadota bacterium]|nr:type 1 glutamine amidotransferase [Gemmatimonadota bacterium]